MLYLGLFYFPSIYKLPFLWPYCVPGTAKHSVFILILTADPTEIDSLNPRLYMRKVRLREMSYQIPWLENRVNLSWHRGTPPNTTCELEIWLNIVQTKIASVLAVFVAHWALCSWDQPISFLSGKHSKYSSWNKTPRIIFADFCGVIFGQHPGTGSHSFS